MKPYKKEKYPNEELVEHQLESDDVEEWQELIEAREEEENWDIYNDYNSCPCCEYYDFEAEYTTEDWISQAQWHECTDIDEATRNKYPAAQTAWEVMTSKLWKVLK